MKHDVKATANSLAVVGGVWYVLCVLWVLVSKSSYMGVIGSWFHGVDFNMLPKTTLSLSSIILGFVSFVVFSWISGYFFAKVYNVFVK